jgi:CRISPR-associated protein (TIGR02710 family)
MSRSEGSVPHIFLIQSVGGSPEPLAYALGHHRPARVCFIVSSDSRGRVSDVVALAGARGFCLGPGMYDLLELPDAEAFDLCLDQIARLEEAVRDWVARGQGGEGAEGEENPYRVVVDFTGGTKVMSAALMVASLRWPCSHAYVGGTRRDPGRLGTVVTGAESVRHDSASPRLRAFLERQRYATLFDSEEFDAAARTAAAMRNLARDAEKREWQALVALAEAYRSWDRFDYPKAREGLKRVGESEAYLRQWPGDSAAGRLLAVIREHRKLLEEVRPEPGGALLADLLANARRCARRGRWDDACARIYRAMEMGAQERLRAAYGIDAGRIRREALPEALRADAWLCPPGPAEPAPWGLRAAYHALELLGDPLGESFRARFGAAGTPSPLEERNQSLLAHGCAPVTEKGYQRLWGEALALVQIQEEDLVRFPKIYPESEG